LILAIASAGCAESEPETGTPGKPVRGGTLVAAIDEDPGQLNPAITTSGAVHTASELMFNGLVKLGPGLEPEPELAESWEVEDNGRTYRFELRDGITWHDGKPFTSKDVKYSFEEVLFELHSRTAASVGAAIDRIETPDERTVVFRFKQPYAPLLQQLDVTEAPIIPAHVYEGTDPMKNPANRKPVGTGPFRFASYDEGQEIVLSANPDYFKPDLPYLGKVVLRVIPEQGNQVIALQSGEVDWLFGVPGPDLERIRQNPDVELLETSVNPGGSNCIMTLSFNLDRAMFQDPAVRGAIASGLDRDQFLERVLFGQGRVADAPIHSGIDFAHAEGLDTPAFDKAEAERLLDEAGWVREGNGVRTARNVEGVPDGTELSFNFLAFPDFAQYGELARAQLAEIGVEVRVEPLESTAFAERVFTERDFDTNIISYCNGNDPAVGVRRMYVSSDIGPVPFSNSSAYRDREVDRLFDAALTTRGREERSDIYRGIQQTLVEDLPYLWIVETVSNRAYRARCRGFQEAGHFAETGFCER
jgi:peptide/nickel transport system substrate-binding protein